MKKISTLLASLPLITTACGGGGGDNTTTNSTNYPSASVDLSQQKSIMSATGIASYTSPSGKTLSIQSPTAIITSNEYLMLLTGTSELYVIEPGSQSVHYFSSFAYSTPLESTQTQLTSSLFTISYYNPKRDAGEQVIIPVDGHYDSAITLANLTGTWNDSYDSNNNWSFDINADGSFTANKNSGGCIGSGTLSHIDITKSELSVSITFNGNCFPLQGTHTGLAWPAEESPGTILNMAVYSALDTSGKAIGWKLNKQQ